MKTTLSTTLSLALTLGSLPLGAKGPVPAVGERCELQRGAVLTKKSNGRGARTALARGALLEVTAVQGGMVLVSDGKKSGYISSKGYFAYCLPVAAVAAPSPAPIEASPAPSVAATEPSVPSPSPQSPPPPRDAAFGATTKTKVAVMDLRGTSDLPKELVAALTTAISETLDDLGAFKAVTSQDIQQLLSFEATRQMLGCDDVSCIAEIGGALGADYLVTGSITLVGELYVTQLQLTRIAETRVDARVARDYRGEKQGLFDELRTATKILVRELLDARSGTVRIAVSEEGATVKIDDSIVGSSPLGPLTVAGGTRTLTVEKQGFVVARRDFEVGSGAETVLEVTLVPSAELVQSYRAAAARTRRLAWSTLGVGGLATLAAGALYVVAARTAAALNDDIAAYNDGSERSTATYEKLGDRQQRLALLDVATLLGAGVGVVALGTGTWLYLSGDDPSRYDTATTEAGVVGSLQLVPLQGGALVGVLGRF